MLARAVLTGRFLYVVHLVAYYSSYNTMYVTEIDPLAIYKVSISSFDSEIALYKGSYIIKHWKQFPYKPKLSGLSRWETKAGYILIQCDKDRGIYIKTVSGNCILREELGVDVSTSEIHTALKKAAGKLKFIYGISAHAVPVFCAPRRKIRGR